MDNEVRGKLFLLNPDNYSINEDFAKNFYNRFETVPTAIEWVHHYLDSLGIDGDLIVNEIEPLWHHDSPNGIRIKCSDPSIIFEYFPMNIDDEYNHMYNAFIELGDGVYNLDIIPIVSKNPRFSSADAAYIACEKYLKKKAKVSEPVPSISMGFDHHMVFEFTYGLPEKYTFIIQEAGFKY